MTKRFSQQRLAAMCIGCVLLAGVCSTAPSWQLDDLLVRGNPPAR